MGRRTKPPRTGDEPSRTLRTALAGGVGAASIAGVAIAGAGTAGVVALAVLATVLVLVMAIPVLGNTIMLLWLARRGLDVLESSDDVADLMESGAAAFTLPFATILRGMPLRRDRPATRKGATRKGVARPPSAPAIERPAEPATDAPSDPALAGNGERRHGPAVEVVPHHTFWGALTPEERGAFEELAERVTFDEGAVLCCRDQPADRVIVIRSGMAQVTTGVDGDDREIARRGPGDIVGERAMLLIRERSATVTALTPMRAMVASAAAFNAFLNDHPRVVAVLERQIYDRLTRSTRPPGEPELTGQHCPVLFVDVGGFSAPYRTDTDRQEIRRALYAVMEEAFERAGISWSGCHREDRGDGALVIAPAAVPAALIVDPLIGLLAEGLARHNRDAAKAVRIRLRAALDVGPVTRDAHGVNGYAIIRAARLMEAPALRRRLTGASVPLGFIVSESVYESVVRHAPGRIDPASYIQVAVKVKEARLTAWVHLPAPDGQARPDDQDRPDGQGPAR
ncbi:Crp/Fnr family transcriptional regulator [Actinomadura sp. 9N407]|uniref:Crp/Fnr family transcriptional regulator n=1 Tax=Actinomadura sp. 9N407 TaxID=3375154 RepID=UPI0037BAD6A9